MPDIGIEPLEIIRWTHFVLHRDLFVMIFTNETHDIFHFRFHFSPQNIHNTNNKLLQLSFLFIWSFIYFAICNENLTVKPRSHCADHSLSMFPIIADRPDLSWSWQNHQIVALVTDLCLSKTASTILVRQLYDTGTTEVFDPLLVRFPRPLVRPLIQSTRLRAQCWRPHPRSCRFATTIKTT